MDTIRRFFKGPAGIMFIIFVIFNLGQAVISGEIFHPIQYLLSFVYVLPGIIIGITVHEFAHAFAAYKLGDNTPKIQGRLSLNPARHIDPIGFVALIFIHFGWGKPVQVNPYAFKKPRRDNLIVDLAGVVTNFVLAFLLVGLYKWVATSMPVSMQLAHPAIVSAITNIIYYAIFMNLVLCIFNLIPVPPLDGFGVITEIFNIRHTSLYQTIYQNGFIILMILMMFGITTKIITPLITAAMTLFSNIWF
ncbi:MAG: site-2 protease family protein [Clostridiales Family XIII bacterium]|jgi:Zn-dependent protease|nr:site-2 protease family protein [Clostridiales Family XIII bacterium]